jgi:hypothetical protein
VALQVSTLVCDEALVSLSGKLTLAGVFTGDIAIQGDEQVTPQLVFIFLIEGDEADYTQSLTLQVTLPGEKPRISAQQIPPLAPGRARWTFRWPFLLTQTMLRPGSIEVKILYEKGEVTATAPRIINTSRHASSLTAALPH